MRKGLADDEKELYEKYKNDPNAPPSVEEARGKEKSAGPVVHRLKNRALVIEQQSGRGGDRSSDSGSRKRYVVVCFGAVSLVLQSRLIDNHYVTL